MALMVLQFVVPLFVLIVTYTRIVVVVWGKRMPGEEDNARDARMARSKRKVNIYIQDFSRIHVVLSIHSNCESEPSLSLYSMTFEFVRPYASLCFCVFECVCERTSANANMLRIRSISEFRKMPVLSASR